MAINSAPALDMPPSSGEAIVAPAPAQSISHVAQEYALSRHGMGHSFVPVLRSALNDDAAVASRSTAKDFQVAEKVEALIDTIAQMSAADYRQVVGKIIDVRMRQGDRNSQIDGLYADYRRIREVAELVENAPNEHFEAQLRVELPALREMAEHRRLNTLAMNPIDVYGALRWDVAKWEFKQNGHPVPREANVVSDDVAKAFKLMLEVYAICHGHPDRRISGKDGQPDMPALLPDESFMTDMQVIARLAYPGGINIFNADGAIQHDEAFSVNSRFSLKTGNKTISIEPGGQVSYFSGVEGVGEPNKILLEDGKAVFFGRELGVGPSMLDGNLTLAQQAFKPEGLIENNDKNRGVSRFAIEIVRTGDKIFVFDRASRNDVEFEVIKPQGQKVTGSYSSKVVEDRAGSLTFGQTNISRVKL